MCFMDSLRRKQKKGQNFLENKTIRTDNNR